MRQIFGAPQTGRRLYAARRAGVVGMSVETLERACTAITARITSRVPPTRLLGKVSRVSVVGENGAQQRTKILLKKLVGPGGLEPPTRPL